MKKILVLGAGRSSYTLIQYLIKNSPKENWQLTIGDYDLKMVEEKTQGVETVRKIRFDVNDLDQKKKEVSQADIVISLLPASLHHLVAAECVEAGVPMVTASYESAEVAALDVRAREKGMLILNEMGLDPGLDHMSAMKIIHRIKDSGAQLNTFESFAGGLVAPESDDNPWHYKFTWNPRNVVLAGYGAAVKFRQEGLYKYIPYHQLFRRTEFIEIDGFGRFEGYANRDSLKYLEVYGLQDIPTIYRGTLRRPGFCRAWDIFVKLGATDDSYTIEGSEDMTYRQFINTFLAYNPHDSVELKLMHYLKLDQDSDIMEKLQWLGIFDHTLIGLKNATPAQILQHILEQKWTLSPHDKDMIVMWNKFIYEENGQHTLLTSSMVVLGDDSRNTGMAKTVGLPLGIATKLILQGKINLSGVHRPISPEIYLPTLSELEGMGISFQETTANYDPQRSGVFV